MFVIYCLSWLRSLTAMGFLRCACLSCVWALVMPLRRKCLLPHTWVLGNRPPLLMRMVTLINTMLTAIISRVIRNKRTIFLFLQLSLCLRVAKIIKR